MIGWEFTRGAWRQREAWNLWRFFAKVLKSLGELDEEKIDWNEIPEAT